MPNVEEDTAHFIPLTDLPRVNARTRVVDVFDALDRSGRSVVVVWDDTQPQWFVERKPLASQVLSDRKAALARPIGELLAEVKAAAFSSIAIPAGAPVPETVPLSGKATEDVLYVVTGTQGVVGYLSSKETFKTTVLTSPPEYECTGPTVHKNRSFNDGRCRFCPFPLKV